VATGFLTDTTVCIGCKACEVACKQWNQLPADDIHFSGASYDNTRQLSATTWRHVTFIEQFDRERFAGLEAPEVRPGALPEGEQWAQPGQRWIFLSDVCKHCVDAPCLEACPTGSIVRTEFDTVYVQQDVCNGCGYCVPACPFGVVQVDRERDGKAHKCTLCYDRLKDGMEPACAKACPTDSIQFGPVDELRERADRRLAKLEAEGWNGPRLYGRDPEDGVGGFGAFFLLLDEPEVYGLPPDPVVTTRDLPAIWRHVGLAAGAVVGAVVAAFVGGSQ
jgi:formate dehydrogenase iron-sulfur subunit